MGEVISIIQAILNGVKKPWQAVAGAVGALFLYIFISVQKGQFRDRKAEDEKNDQKDESNIDLENSNAETDQSMRDRLERRGQPPS